MKRAIEVSPILAMIASLAVPIGSALAAPVVDLSWDACTPITSAKIPAPGETTFKLYVSATGFDEPIRAYQVKVWFAGEMHCRSGTSTPDAWRFDSGGCQPFGAAQVRFNAPSKTCPSLGDATQGVTIQPIQYTTDSEADLSPANAMRVWAQVSWFTDVPTSPSIRYQLMRLEFDHTFSVAGAGTPGETCGGYDAPVCFALWRGLAYTDQGVCGYGLQTGTGYIADGQFRPMTVGHGAASFGLTPGTAFSCFEVTPTAGATWGAIKAQYR